MGVNLTRTRIPKTCVRSTHTHTHTPASAPGDDDESGRGQNGKGANDAGAGRMAWRDKTSIRIYPVSGSAVSFTRWAVATAPRHLLGVDVHRRVINPPYPTCGQVRGRQH
jgi:hypothetical protein